MQTFVNKLVGAKQLQYSSIMVAYQTESGTWRGFVLPFDVTYEADTQEEVMNVLREMLDAYLDGLKTYRNPSHLSQVPLSDSEDQKKWSEITLEVFNKLSKNVAKIAGHNYYAEAQLPA